jgi:hypothetical protein
MEDKKISRLEQLNLLAVGAIVGAACMGLFASFCFTKDRVRQNKIIEAYREYYISAETLLDSLDETRNLNLMDTDLCSEYGAEYLHFKHLVDSLTNSYDY